MKILPQSRQAWSGLFLLPFKAYVVAAPICLCLWRVAILAPRAHSPRIEAQIARTDAALAVAIGLMFCLGVFLVAGLVQFWDYRHQAARVSFGFAVAALVILYLYVLPLCAS